MSGGGLLLTPRGHWARELRSRTCLSGWALRRRARTAKMARFFDLGWILADLHPRSCFNLKKATSPALERYLPLILRRFENLCLGNYTMHNLKTGNATFEQQRTTSGFRPLAKHWMSFSNEMTRWKSPLHDTERTEVNINPSTVLMVFFSKMMDLRKAQKLTGKIKFRNQRSRYQHFYRRNIGMILQFSDL